MTAPRMPGQRTCGRCGKPTATAIGIPTEKGIVRPRPYCDDHRADAEAARDAEMKHLNGQSNGPEGAGGTVSEPHHSAPAKESAMDARQDDLFAGGGQ